MRRGVIASLAVAAALGGAACDFAPSGAEPSPAGRAPGAGVLSDRLAEAALAGNRRAVEAMLPDADVNAKDTGGRTMLMLAAYDGHADTVRLLCESKADPNLMDPSRRTALMYAASGPNASTVEILLAHGAQVNLIDGEEGWTALMFASAEGHADIVRMLLAEGADPDLMDIDGESALTFASNNGHDSVVEILSGSRAR